MKIKPHFHHSVCSSFVTNSPVAEKALSGSINLGVIVINTLRAGLWYIRTSISA